MILNHTQPWFQITPLAPDLFGIAERGHCEEVLSFLMVGRNEATLIDSGLGLFSMKAAVQRLTALPCQVLNTHSHFDHVGSNYEFQKVALFDHPDNRRAAEHGFSSEYLKKWSTEGHFRGARPVGMKDPYCIPGFPQASFFQNGAVLKQDACTLTVLHTPGHSDDSVCFYEPDRGWLFAGDLLYDGPIYIERAGGLSKYRESIALVLSLDNVQRIFCSHNDFEVPIAAVHRVSKALESVATRDLETEIQVTDRLRLVPG